MEVPCLDAAGTSPFSVLNEAQRVAVEHPLDPQAPPLLIVAGAGTGKTKTLTSRVARLVLAGADPQRVMLLTFSRRAALEMTRRAASLLQAALGLNSSQRAPVLPWAGTFHSIGARLLRDYAPRIGLAEHFTVLDRGDSEDLIDWLRHELGLSKTHARFPLKGTCLAIYSRVLNSQLRLSEVLQRHYPWCANVEAELKALFSAYEQAKQRQCCLDFDDLLLYWAAMLEDETLAAEIGARFDHVLVDEYQDTNRVQALILQRMKPDGRGVVAVGDDAQAIYSFRAAEVRNILEFERAFATPVRRVALERNYRSTQALLDASNALIALSPQRLPKMLWTDKRHGAKPQLVTVEDEAAQARWVADRVLEHREAGLRLRDQAVLFRTNHHSSALELELTRRNIPYVKYGGLKFLDAAHVKDVLSVLRWVENPRNEQAGFRVAKLLSGFGPASARKLVDAVLGQAEPVLALQGFKPPSAGAEPFAEFMALYSRLREPSLPWPSDLALAIEWYRPQLERRHEDAAVRSADLAQLQRIAAGHGSRERFLTELALDPPAATSDESGDPSLDEDYLILSTIHSAKGQEWRAVQVLNVVDGCIPSDISEASGEQLEEERRLLYVAMTRAKEHLHLLVPQRFYVHQQAAYGDRHVYAALTRFITPSIEHTFEAIGPVARALPVPGATSGGPIVDLTTRLRGRWD
jgi:DNA helicase-2/ATP-dependent DNA helicase PcrA